MSPSTIFMVDDSRRVLDATAATLRSYGFRVETYDDPVRFLREIDPERPGVLLLDLRMPELAGLDVLGRLRERGVLLPVLFLSAHAEIDHVVRAIKGGARDFLLKPVGDEELVARLQDAVEADLRARASRQSKRWIFYGIQTLSPRETEVLDAVIQGQTAREIADQLGIRTRRSSRTGDGFSGSSVRRTR